MEEASRFLTRAPGRTERLCTDRQRQGGAILDDQEFRFGHLECEMPVNSSLKVGTLREVQAGGVSLRNINVEGGLTPLRLDEITKGLNITREVMKMGFFFFLNDPPTSSPSPQFSASPFYYTTPLKVRDFCLWVRTRFSERGEIVQLLQPLSQHGICRSYSSSLHKSKHSGFSVGSLRLGPRHPLASRSIEISSARQAATSLPW